MPKTMHLTQKWTTAYELQLQLYITGDEQYPQNMISFQFFDIWTSFFSCKLFLVEIDNLPISCSRFIS